MGNGVSTDQGNLPPHGTRDVRQSEDNEQHDWSQLAEAPNTNSALLSNRNSYNNRKTFVINRFFMKMFRTNNIEIVRNCQSYLGFNLPSDLWPNRIKRFDVKYATSGGSFVKYGFTVA